MKKIISLLLAAIMCFSFFSCDSNKFDQESYDNYLLGKVFESDGRMLYFDENNSMTYYYQNKFAKDSFYYTYAIVNMVKKDNTLVMTLQQTYANTDIENIDKDKLIEAIYHISEDEIEYYSCRYSYGSKESEETVVFDQDSFDTHLSGKKFELDGRILSFENNCMTYNFTNGIGETYIYTYSIIVMDVTANSIYLTLKLTSANNSTDLIDENSLEEAIYYISSNSIDYSSSRYTYID